MEAFLLMLESAGYSRVNRESPVELGYNEYMRSVVGSRMYVTLGPGRAGDDLCYVNFQFSLDGAYLEHSAGTEGG